MTASAGAAPTAGPGAIVAMASDHIVVSSTFWIAGPEHQQCEPDQTQCFKVCERVPRPTVCRPIANSLSDVCDEKLNLCFVCRRPLCDAAAAGVERSSVGVPPAGHGSGHGQRRRTVFAEPTQVHSAQSSSGGQPTAPDDHHVIDFGLFLLHLLFFSRHVTSVVLSHKIFVNASTLLLLMRLEAF